jgi:predicted dehydrogenase
MSLSWGIAATGRIARTVGTLIAQHPEMHVAAVGSRDLSRAAALASDLAAPAAYGSYAELVADPAVDAVYVATPHAQHAAVVQIALAAGKAVLCEKPLTHDLGESSRLAGLALSTGTFLMEAMWTRFNPLVQQLRQAVLDGTLGEVRSIHASFGFPAPFDPAGRLWDPSLGGGALLDLGVYTVDFARLLLGTPSVVTARGSLADTGVDAEESLLLQWESGATALLDTSLLVLLPNTATVIGSGGTAVLSPSFHAPTSLRIARLYRDPEEHRIADRTAGMIGELEEVARCRTEGRGQSTIMPLEESLATMRVLDQARQQLHG